MEKDFSSQGLEVALMNINLTGYNWKYVYKG